MSILSVLIVNALLSSELSQLKGGVVGQRADNDFKLEMHESSVIVQYFVCHPDICYILK